MPATNQSKNLPTFTPGQIRTLRRKLLNWYRRSHRRLPWRAETGGRVDPYHTMVSEAMLQASES